jgi:hypothetical protein
LKRENKAAEEQAQRLAAYVQFQQLRETRMQTVASLADSRFDWERVMRELALVLPHDVWLTSLDASASAGSEGGEGGGTQLRGQVAGPALELSGCATGQEAVAGFITVLKDIDGVTRVGLERSELPAEGEGGASAGGEGGGGSGGECQTREFISSFSLVVAFDAAPVPPSESGAEVAPVPSETAESTASESESSESAESAEGSEG